MGNISGIDITRVEPGWEQVVAAIRCWGEAGQVQWRDAIVLLPFAQLLPLARSAWAKGGGFLPRIETTETLARSLAPPPLAGAGQITFDTVTDRLIAARMLAEQSWVRGRAADDPLYGEQLVANLVEVAQAIARAVAAVTPAQRAIYWQRSRELLAPIDGPGATERALARLALEWAAASADPATDALFALRPSAWVAVQAGGSQRMVQGLLEEAESSVTARLIVDTDVALEAPFESIAGIASCDLAPCDDFEDEAQRAAAQVLAHLQQGQLPVALIAQDRQLVRRVRALLARRAVPIADETGWTLSTTRAAASLMSWLHALSARASSDQILDALKASPRLCAPSVASLEAALRKRRWANVDAVQVERLDPGAAALWQDLQRRRAQVAAPARRPLSDWLGWLHDMLAEAGLFAAMQSDAAGMQVLGALRLLRSGAIDTAWHDAARDSQMSFEQFTRFAAGALEQENFRADALDAQPGVIITPLARAMLRPFAAVVCPGADEKRLDQGTARLPLVSDAEATALGIDGAEQRRDRELLAFAQLLRAPRVSLLHRLREEDEALGASPLVERLALAMRRRGRELAGASDTRRRREVAALPVQRPRPAAPALLPGTLSASAIEALRECPYRFYALYMLRLRDAPELDDTVEKRDYGSWLHAVLNRFHRARNSDARTGDAAQLAAAASIEREAQGLDEATFLPFAAQFERLLPHYIEWLHKRDAEGASWCEGESDMQVAPEQLRGTQLRGRIDRIDSLRHAHGASVQLIDYKTGNAIDLKRRIRQQPAEDTQLAVYAALMSQRAGAVPGTLEACYLPLDDGQPLQQVEHPRVEATAQLLLDGLGAELQRLRAGSALPALGEGGVCGYCKARGLCRRDDWSSP